jgi:hypothetical protein
MLTFDGGNSRHAFHWQDGTIDNSLRGYEESVLSGSAIILKRSDDYTIKGVTIRGGADWSDNVGDSGFSPLHCKRGRVTECTFIGQPDLGIYATGNNNNNTSDDEEDLLISDCTFIRCKGAVSSKRQAARVVLQNSLIYECYNGFTEFEASTTILPGRQSQVRNNTFKYTETRAIEFRSQGGSSAIGNLIEDFGYNRAGSAVTANAIQIAGGRNALVCGNTIRMEDWEPHATQTAFSVSNYTIDSTLYTGGRNVFDGNLVDGIYRVAVEASTDANTYRNVSRGYTVAFNGLAAGTIFQYTDETNQWRMVYGSTEHLRVNSNGVTLTNLRFFAAPTTAGTPASFSANRYITVNFNGTNMYIPVATATW